MQFPDLNIKYEYRSSEDDIVKDFLKPTLKNSIKYKRSVGFFTSSSLTHLGEGIEGLVKNGGSIKLVVSPKLTEEDIQAISKGYELRNQIITNALNRELKEPIDEFQKHSLNKLANLVARGQLDIKVAFLEENKKIGMYHEKLGLLEDKYGNIISFSGSMNESSTAFYTNYETVDVFRSWILGEKERVYSKINSFDRIWNNEETKLVVKEYPEFNKTLVRKYIVDNGNLYNFSKEDHSEKENQKNIPILPDYITLYDYQNEAIENWKKDNYNGIFDMATGTGKTFTALAGLVELSSSLNNNLSVIIVCPFQHLVEQWVEDLEEFNIEPIIGYSSSKQKDWEKRLEEAVREKRLNIKKNKFFCFITTNATFASQKVQKHISRLGVESLIIVDEAHNFGTEGLLRSLPHNFKYRLALSATFERHMDSYGTKKLYEYFGKKVIEYPISQAIKEGKLTKYIYKPVLVELTDDELDEYIAISKKIGRNIRELPCGTFSLTQVGKLLAIKRSKVIAGAQNKLNALETEIKHYKHDNHILVYCGSTNIIDYEKNDYSVVDNEDIRQIDEVMYILGEKLNMRAAKFTSQETMNQRKQIIEDFSEGDTLQALVAIKCLDEGVNIPDIKTTFILASTTNPKEYIQRRGRVLRLAEGKTKAKIYDFITLPRNLNSASSLTIDERKLVDTLLKNEITRMKEFASDAFNKSECFNKIDEIRRVYKIN